MTRSTLIRSPAVDTSKSPIENVLELTPLSDLGPDIFTNTRELWHPPGARGIYGGAVIAQSLAAAQKTIPLPSTSTGNATFLIHSMHCYFVLAGDSTIPIIYYVERVREGRSFMTRTVQARQKGKCIFTTTCSFVREGSGGEKVLEHEWGMPEGAREELEALLAKTTLSSDRENPVMGIQASGPFMMESGGIINKLSPNPHCKKTRQWGRARGKISSAGGRDAHLSALAYMSDSWFVGTIPRVHDLWPFPQVPSRAPFSDKPVPLARPSSSSSNPSPPSVPTSNLAAPESTKGIPSSLPSKPVLGMILSLDHIIYFHRPREIVADDWVLSEKESPWSGEGRGLVMQKIWSREGQLLASCFQEGLVRLKKDAIDLEVIGKSKL